MENTLAKSHILPSCWSLLKDSFSLYKKRLKALLGLAAINVFISIFLMIIQKDKEIRDVLLSNSIIIFSLAIIYVVFLLWSYLALLYAIKDSEENIGVLESYRRSFGKILSFFWLGVLVYTYYFLGLILLIVPLIIFATWFCFTKFILISENLKGINALIKSREYVKGIFFKVLGRVLYIYFLLFLTIFIIYPFSHGFHLSLIENVSIQNNILGTVIMAIFSQILMIYLFLLYGHVKNINGQIDFIVTKGRKIKYIVAAIFGVLAYIALIVIMVIGLIMGLSAAKKKRSDLNPVNMNTVTEQQKSYPQMNQH